MMMDPQVSESLKFWALAVVFLFLKMLFNSGVQGYARKRDQRVYFKEDEPVFHGKLNREPTELQTRADSLWENDGENSPIFLFLLLGYALIVGDARWTAIFAVAFCAARVGHARHVLLG
jgi:uncharacterized membrane protein YecN with MAPEG domain